MIIRHEINLLDTPLISTTANVDSPERVYLPMASGFSGTLSSYLEVVYTNTSTSARNIKLFYNGGASEILYSGVLSASVSSFTLLRLSFGQTINAEYFLQLGLQSSGTCTIKSARFIIIQDTGTSPLTASETQIEIGSNQTGITAATPAALSAPKYFKYDSSLWDGAITAWFEATINSATTKVTVTAKLQVADGTGDGFVGWADVTNGTLTSVAGTATRVRSSSAVTLVSGRNYRVVVGTSTSKSAVAIYNAKIIIQQLEGASQGPDWTQSADYANINGGTSTTAGAAQSFTVSKTDALTGVYLVLRKSGTPTDNLKVDIVSTLGGSPLASGTIAGSVISGAPTTAIYLITFSSPFTPTAGTTYYLQFTRSVDVADASHFYWINASSIASTLQYPGTAYNRSNATWSSGNPGLLSTEDIYFLFTGITGIAKLEEQYLLANATLAAGTALQNFLTKWDSAEWSGVDNVYVHAVNASDNNTSVVELDTAGGTQVQAGVARYIDNSVSSDVYYINDGSPSNSGWPQPSTSATGTGLSRSIKGDGRIISKVSFGFIKTGSPVGTISAKIYASTGTYGTNAYPTGSALATSDVINFSALPANGLQVFTFSGANLISLTDGTVYCVVVTVDSVTTLDNTTNQIGEQTITTAYEGNGGVKNTTAGSWAASANTVWKIEYVSGGITMPSNGNLDVKATTNSGNIYASRILVRVLKAAGSQTAAPGVGQLIVTGFAPIINVTQSVTTALGQLTLTGQAPSLNAGILTGLGALTVTGFAPTVNITTNISVSVGLGQLTVTGFAPIVNIMVSATPGVGQLLATGFSPGLNAGIQVPLGQLTITGFSPIISITDHKSAAPGLGQLTISGLAPSLNAGVQVPLGQLTITGFNPTINITRSSLPGTGQLIVTGLAPSLNAGLQVGVGQLTITGFSPTINISQSALPGAGQLAVTGLAPSLNAGIQIPLGQLTVTGFSPIILITQSAAPGTGQLSLAGQAPSLNAGIQIPLGQLTITGFNPTINVTQSAATGLGQLTVTGFSPSISVGLPIGTGQLIITGYEPTVNITRSALPGTGQLDLTGQAPSLNASLGIGLGQLIITGLSPTVNISQSASPALGQLTITGFAPSLNAGLQVGLGQLTVTGFAPSIPVRPSTGQLIITGFEPTLTTSDSQVAGTNTGQLIIVGYEPVVNISRSALPETGQLIITGFEPLIGSSQSVITQLGELTITGYEPTINISQSAQPAAGQLTITGFEPSISSSNAVSVSPNTGEITVIGYSPTVNISVSVSLDIGELVINGLPPTIDISSTMYVVGTGQLIITGFRPVISIAKNIILNSDIETELIVESYIQTKLELTSEIDNHLILDCAST